MKLLKAPIFLFALPFLISQELHSQSIDPTQIEIIRDQYGVPHIYAPTDSEVAYGLAWAHAEDDFETIQLPLLSGKQMMGLHLGKDGAAIDYVVHLLRLEELAKKEYQKLTPAFKAIIQGYMQGINAFAREHPKRVLLKKSFPVNEIDIMKTYGISLAVTAGVDQTIKRLVSGEVETAHLVEQNGSNAMAVSREKTTDEFAYLAINSHQPFEGPVAWYEAHLCSEEGWNMLGGLFPGAPVVLLGTNENLGWAHTVNYPDKVDVYQLRVDPKNRLKYKVGEDWRQLESNTVKLKVKLPLGLKISVKKEVLWSDFGPVIENEKGTFAFHLSTLDDISALQQWYFMNKATNFQEFQDALKAVSIPGFNVVYGDKANNIMHVGYGKIPKRAEGYDWTKVILGDKRELLPAGYHSLDDLPKNLNPVSGFVFNMNNSAYSSSSAGNNPDPKEFDETMGFTQWENNRSTRFLTLMEEQETLSFEEFKKIKYDITLPDSLVFPLDINGLFSLPSSQFSAEASEIQKYIVNWDRKATTDALGPAQAIMMYQFLQEELKVPYKGYYRVNAAQFEMSLSKVHQYFMKHFGKTDVRLGEFQFLVRGKKEIPQQGVDDVIAAIRSVPHKKGKVRAFQGESYIMMIKYQEDGLPIIETVNVYGASNVPGNKHYDDQMELFNQQLLKPMTLDIEKVKENAERIYHPN